MQSRATRVVLAALAAGALACGEDILVSSWELGLKAAEPDAAAPVELDLPQSGAGADAGALNYQAISASQRARVQARKDEENWHGDNHASSDKSSH
jgi:hypothetical protein